MSSADLPSDDRTQISGGAPARPRDGPSRAIDEATRAQVFDGDIAPPLPSPPPRLPAGGRYRVIRAHARGGLGVVSLAEDTGLRRPVALKEIQPRHADDARSRRRFVQEAEITGRLQHPGIVPVHDLGHDAFGRPFYTMRFVEGETLFDAIQRFHAAGPAPGDAAAASARRVALRQLLGRFVDVCNAVAYAHSAGVIHRDLKPQNILLGRFGETLLVDWGLAKYVRAADESSKRGLDAPRPAAGEADDATELPSATVPPASGGSTSVAEDLTQFGLAIGTPGYMSPEQAAGHWDEVGPASDVYSLGVTLAFVLTGRAPSDPAPAPAPAVVPRALEAVCRKATAARPADRYDSALALAADVEHWLADEPVSACPESLLVRLGRWVRRRQALVTGAAAAALVGGAALTAGVLLLSLWNRQLRAANDVQAELRRVAEVHADRAEDRFRQARRAVDEFFTEVSENPRLLRQEPGTQTLRKALLERARGYYEEFLRERGDDPSVRADAAAACHRLAMIVHELQPGPQARALYERARTLRMELAAAHPDDTGAARDLATTENDLGTLLSALGDHTAAMALFESARGARQSLVAAQPEDLRAARDLARTVNNIGFTLHALGRSRDGLAACRQARDLLADRAGAHADDTETAHDLGATLNNVAALERAVGETEPSLASFRKARTIQERLVAARPERPDYAVELAKTNNNLAITAALLNRPDEARTAYARALEIQERLVRENPGVAEYVQELATTHNTLGALHRNRGDLAAAAASFRTALAAQEELARKHAALPSVTQDVARTHNNLAVVLRDQGQAAEALAVQQRARELQTGLARAHPRVADYAAELAKSHANLALLHRGLGQLPEARAAVTDALALRERLSRDHRDVPTYRFELAATYVALAGLARAAKEPRTALDAAGRAVELLDALAPGPSPPRVVRPLRAAALRVRAQALTDLGQDTEARAGWAAALREATAIADDPAFPAAARVEAARVFVAADASSESSAGRALAELKRAQTAGLFRFRAAVAELRADEELAALHARPEFWEWLGALRAQAAE